MEDTLKQQQNISFSGAGDSHQYGGAEHTVKILVTMERTMGMNNAMRCPDDEFPTNTWPMTMDT